MKVRIIFTSIKSCSWRSKSQILCDRMCSWVCARVYRRAGSQEGAAALLMRGHFVLHWVTGPLETHVPGFLRKVPVGCCSGEFNLRKWHFLLRDLDLAERTASHNNACWKWEGAALPSHRPGPVPSWRSGPAGAPDKHLPWGCDEEEGAQQYKVFWWTPWCHLQQHCRDVTAKSKKTHFRKCEVSHFGCVCMGWVGD